MSLSAGELKELNKILTSSISAHIPWYEDVHESKIDLTSIFGDWLFETSVNLPSEVKKEFEDYYLNVETPIEVKIERLSEILEEMDISSAPKWWELDHFKVSQKALWRFFTKRCVKNWGEEPELMILLQEQIKRADILGRATYIMWQNENAADKPAEQDLQAATDFVDSCYPLDFRDFDEKPGVLRSPFALIRSLIGHELRDLSQFMSARWLEFKILDELAHISDQKFENGRKHKISQQFEVWNREYMKAYHLSLGRMVEHYRWKVTYEDTTHLGIRARKTHAKAGESGKKGMQNKRAKNVRIFWNEVKALAHNLGIFTETQIFDAAWGRAWPQWQNSEPHSDTRANYETIVKSEEYRNEYQTLFLIKP